MSTRVQKTGISSLSTVTLVVGDLETALEFYTGKLDFEVVMDSQFEMDGVSGRWLTVGLPAQNLEIALVTPDEPYYDEETRQQLRARMGVGTGWTFRTDDCEATIDALEAAGVAITQEPTEYEWGIEAAFLDPFGNESKLFEYATE
jgi:catechol 2,3-dioxygenase-like lactoylglutathione lyase family enzyme